MSNPNKRPDMERITTPELAKAFIDEQIEALRAQIGGGKCCWRSPAAWIRPSSRRC